jgi:putative ABC transport system permease protein
VYSTRKKKCMLKLAKKDFLKNRTRNIVAVLAMILTTVLFATLITTGVGAYESVQLTLQKQKGSKADADIRYMTEEQFEKLSKDERVDFVGLRRPIGFLSNAKTHNIELDYMDSIEQELTFSVPTLGCAPTKENEIATTDRALESLGIKPKVGAEVEIEFELRNQIHQYKMVVSGIWEAPNSQTSLMLVSDKFMQENEEIFPYTFDKDRQYAGTYFSDIALKNTNNMEEQLQNIVLSLGGNPEDANAENYIAYAVNRITNPEMTVSVLIIGLVFALLFVFAGYLLIFNIFEISVLRDVQKYGLLKTIGTTQKQIKFLVRIQTLWLLLIALPCGLLIGYFLGKAILSFAIGFITNEYSNLSVEVSPNIIIFLGAAVFTIFTVLVSVRKPINIISKISPMEALRYSEKTEKSKKIKHTKKISVWRLALSNVKRRKKRSVFIVISMTLCCMLFNSTLIIVNSIDIEKALKEQCAADVVIANGNTFNNIKGYIHHTDRLDENIVELVEDQFDIEDKGLIYKNTLDDRNVTIDYGLTYDKADLVKEDGKAGIMVEQYYIPLGYDDFPVCNVYGCNENVFQRCNFLKIADDISVAELYQKLEEGNYVVEAVRKKQGQSSVNMEDFQCEIGDKIKVRSNGEEERELEVIAQMSVTSTEYEVPNVTTGITAVGGDAPMFYISENTFKNIYEKPSLMSFSFNVDKEELVPIMEQIDKLVEQKEGEIGCSSVIMLRNSLSGIKNTVYIIGGFISVILGMSGFINFINLMITNIITRKKEYAVMQSIGMTTKQLIRLIVNEGLLYALSSAVLGIVLSVLVGGTMIKIICNAIWFMTYKLLLWSAITLSVVTIILSGVIPVIVFKSFNKESIVEKIRKDF